MGIPYRIVEKKEALGGTWRVNRYPGCGVDTPNHSYSFSFGQRYKWSRYFSRREEIEDYLDKIADEFALRSNISFRTRLTQARWDPAKHKWIAVIESDRGVEEIHATLLVTAVGQLSEPTIPPLKGRDDFEGLQFHPADWSDGTNILGKSVAIIGTGASSMQIVPTIADSVGSVTIYQRTAQWARPIAGYSDLINEGTQWLLQHVPFYAEWFRFNMFWRYGDSLLPFLKKDPTWPHKDRSINRGNERHREELIDYINSELAGRPDLIDKAIPAYPPFGKRILLDNGWYRALLKPNVDLVVDAIDHLEKDAIVTVDGSRRLTDVIIWATGFDLSQLAARLNITGLNGKTLTDEWKGDPKAYLGIAVPGFPNFFCMLGPNSGLGHGGSTIFQSECQARYISSCIVSMVENDISAINVRRDAFESYVQQVDAEHEQMIWTHPGMTTYYRNQHGRVFSVMPWRLVDYWSMTHDPDLSKFELSRRDLAA
jgi:4-hydroxyacetophenone monooxygenase